MSIEQLLIDYHIPYQKEGHKHCRPGWANMPCPFCSGNPGLHLGVELETVWFTCWRCGYHRSDEAVAKLVGVSLQEARDLLKKYRSGPFVRRSSSNQHVRIKPFRLPSHCAPLDQNHRRYLIRRGFDPDALERDYKLLGTGPVSELDGISYKYRVVAPIFWDGQEVSFQARDITGKALQRYLACPKSREEVHHKHILYGRQDKWRSTGICAEGITDVWKMGPSSFAVFGIKVTMEQVLEIDRHFKRVVILFDDDPQAKEQAKRLAVKLTSLGKPVHIEEIEGDPGGLPIEDARKLSEELLRWGTIV